MQIWQVLIKISKKVLPESTVFSMVPAIVVVLKSRDFQPWLLWRPILYGSLVSSKRFWCFFWGELIDKYKDINANSKTVFTDYAMLKLVHNSPHMFLVFCQSKVGVVKKILLNSENWDLAGTYYHIDAMHAGNQLNRSERFTWLISDTDHSVSIRLIYISHIFKFRS